MLGYARRVRREYGLTRKHPLWDHAAMIPLGLPEVVVTDFLPGFIARGERYQYNVVHEFAAAIRRSDVVLTNEDALALVELLARDRRDIGSAQDLAVLRDETSRVMFLTSLSESTDYLSASDIRVALLAAENGIPLEYASVIGTTPSAAGARRTG